jgi:hypothetical protein
MTNDYIELYRERQRIRHKIKIIKYERDKWREYIDLKDQEKKMTERLKSFKD